MEDFDRASARSDIDILEILQEGRRLVAQGWCQGALAKDADGRAVEACSSAAIAFDAVGAIERAVFNLLGGDRRYLIQSYYKGFYALAWGLHTHSRLAAWNDDPLRCQTDVLERFDLAITRALRPETSAPRVAA